MNKQQSSKNVNLFSEFNIPSYSDWVSEAELSLKGKKVEQLITNTYEGIKIQPIYNKSASIDEANQVYRLDSISNLLGIKNTRYKDNPWLIKQILFASTPEEFNTLLINELENGQNCIYLDFSNKLKSFYKDSFILSSINDLKIMFKSVNLYNYPIILKIDLNNLKPLFLILDLFDSNEFDCSKISFYLEFDPLSNMLTEGNKITELNEIIELFYYLNKNYSIKFKELKLLNISGTNFSDNGSDLIQEVAFSFSSALEYIRQFEIKEIDLKPIFRNFSFSFSIGSNFFLEIAKFRAARIVWSYILSKLDITEENPDFCINAVTSLFNQSELDSNTNMLRSTSESISAIIGGIDGLTVYPFDMKTYKNSSFSVRTSRNLQNVLFNECNLTEVIDAASGSYYIDDLTKEISNKIIELLNKIEAEGGYLECIKNNSIQNQILKIADTREKNILTRKDVLIGVNKHPNMKDVINRTFSDVNLNEIIYNEELINQIKSIDSFDGKIDILKSRINKLSNDDIYISLFQESELKLIQNKPFNPTDKFVRLREISEKYKSLNGKYPEVYPICFGSLKQYKARFDFSNGFFSVGSILLSNIINNITDIENPLLEFKNSGSKAVVLCSSDDVYSDILPILIPRIKIVNPDTYIILAGYPIDKVQYYTEIGVDDFIHLKADVYGSISKLLAHLTK